MRFEIIHKPTFTNQLLALPKAELGHILEKIELLRESPQPDAKNKKRLHGYEGFVCRIRSGNYRILYTFGEGWVALLGVDHRKDVYEGDRLIVAGPEFSPESVPSVDALLKPEPSPSASGDGHQRRRTHDAADDLPVKIDDALLERLRVPDAHIPALRGCKTIDDLLAADVPEAVRDRVFDVVTAPDYDRVMQEPSYVTGDVDDLLRFAEGELLGFLLKLDPEQERYVDWAVRGAGPTLVKGGPGTGKSTVALYRARSLISALRRDGIEQPRLLFTTYTNALVNFSRQLLDRLLAEDAALATVRTADSLVMEIVQAVDGPRQMADSPHLRDALAEALTTAQFDGNALQRRAQAQTIERIGPDYLLEEIGAVIEGRGLPDLDAYLATPRAGRQVPLNATQRTAIWRVHEALQRALVRHGLTTWHALRRRAAEIVATGGGPARFDGVIVDEAQDLDPTVLRLLVDLSRTPDRLFVTADANQSIYGSGFRWTDVHADLRFQGRTGILRTNHRSTREIGEAARAYLRAAALDSDDAGVAPSYSQSGPLPAIRAVPTAFDETQLLARFLTGAAHEFRLGVGACAVLVPTEAAGKSIAAWLADTRVEAAFMTGRELDLERRAVKVITLKSAKGLEFPIVALAGFGAGYPGLPKTGEPAELAEALNRERRTMYVAMTRAMRALLVVLPAKRSGPAAPLLDGFDAAYWNLGSTSAVDASGVATR